MPNMPATETAQPDYTLDYDEDEVDTGLSLFIGPIAEPREWDTGSDKVPPLDVYAIEFYRRRLGAEDLADVFAKGEKSKERIRKARLSADERAFLEARQSNRIDIIAKMCGLSNTGALRAAAPRPANDNIKPMHGVDAETLLGMEFAPVKYVIPGYVAEGLTILGGRPKLGKSWLALDFGIAVASGGACLGVKCDPGDAVYYALEDNLRRLQDRLRLVLPANDRSNISRLSLHTEAPKINAGLIEQLDAWRTSVADPRLVIIDTLAMVRPPKGRNQDSYAADYDALSPLQRWASEHRVAVVVVTHVRKMEAEDPLEMISGTNGLTGAADSILILNRTTDGTKLYGRGRDVEEVEKVIRFDAGRWFVVGGIEEVKRSVERTAILVAVSAGHTSPAEIAKATGFKPVNVRYLLGKMVEAGQVEKSKFGLYVPPSHPSHPLQFNKLDSPSQSESEDCEDCEGGTPHSFDLKKSATGAFPSLHGNRS